MSDEAHDNGCPTTGPKGVEALGLTQLGQNGQWLGHADAASPGSRHNVPARPGCPSFEPEKPSEPAIRHVSGARATGQRRCLMSPRNATPAAPRPGLRLISDGPAVTAAPVAAGPSGSGRQRQDDEPRAPRRVGDIDVQEAAVRIAAALSQV